MAKFKFSFCFLTLNIVVQGSPNLSNEGPVYCSLDLGGGGGQTVPVEFGNAPASMGLYNSSDLVVS